MKNSFWIAAVCLFALVSGCATNSTSSHHHAGKVTKPTIVDAACGQCLLGLKGEKKGCDLAVRLDGHSYFVDGFTMKQLGNAHADDGMCNAVRKAKVTGHVENGRFAASTFELLPVQK